MATKGTEVSVCLSLIADPVALPHAYRRNALLIAAHNFVMTAFLDWPVHTQLL